jgi:hypothetical protein
VFHGVDNASEIRDLVQVRLRAFRQAGLGDPDDTHSGETAPPDVSMPDFAASAAGATAAARDLLHEARLLKESLL